MRDCYVIVYNEHDRTGYLLELDGGDGGALITTVPTVTRASLYDTWDEAMDRIQDCRNLNKKLGYESGMMFPMSVNRKDLFKAKLKHGNG